MTADTGIWISEEITVDDTTTVHNIPVPVGCWIHEIMVKQGATDLGSNATMSFMVPSLNDFAILNLGTGRADNNEVYAVRTAATSTNGNGIGGTAVPIHITSGGINVQGGGTIATGGSALVKIIAATFPPIFNTNGG